MPFATENGPNVTSFVAGGGGVTSSSSRKYCAFAGSALGTENVSDANAATGVVCETLNTTQKKGTAPVTASGRRANREGAGAFGGAVMYSVALSVSFGGAPGFA